MKASSSSSSSSSRWAKGHHFVVAIVVTAAALGFWLGPSWRIHHHNNNNINVNLNHHHHSQQQQQQDKNPPSSLSITKFTAVDANNVLNIHIVPHSHDDVGWRKTVQQYYTATGSNNNSIDNRGNVQAILSTTISALLQHTARTFCYVEMKFFSTWWHEQQRDNDAMKDSVRYLLANQQWSFVNGGWCMHDEAAAHYIGMLDQMTTGHVFLQQELFPKNNKNNSIIIPTIAWQLDPFGHSATQASLLSQSFDAIYFGRIDDQDLRLRQLTQQCEGLWHPSTAASSTTASTSTASSSTSAASQQSSFNTTNTTTSTTTTTTTTTSSSGSSNTTTNNNNNNNKHAFFHPIFWGLTGSYRGNYGAPDTFCFDVLCDNNKNEPLVGVNETRLLQRITTFLQDMRIQADQTVDNHILVTMGSDFNYMEAHQNFANLDLLISSIMDYQRYGQLDVPAIMGPKYDRVQIFYSSPDYYTKQKHASWKKQQLQQQKMRMQQEQEQEPAEGQVPPTSTATTTTTTTTTPPAAAIWQTKTDDFFPYSDCEHCFWTGYFTSRTTFKRMERVASSFLLAARQIDALATAAAAAGGGAASATTTTTTTSESCNCDDNRADCAGKTTREPCKSTTTTTGSSSCCCCCCDPPLFVLEDALGVAQHHDAISGTAKQHVADDYSFRLHHGLQSAAKHVGRKLQRLLLGSHDRSNSTLEWTYCPLLHNESICDLSVEATRSNDKTTVYTVVYNALPRNRSTIVRLPVASLDTYQVLDLTSNLTQLVSSVSASLVKLDDEPRYVLFWDSGTLPPLGLKTFSITKTDSDENDEFDIMGSPATPTEVGRMLLDDNTVQVTNGLVTVDIDASTGQIKRMASNGIEVGLQQSWGYYTSFDSKFDRSEVQPLSSREQNSGAYIFRPSTPTQELIPLKPRHGAATFVNTSVGTEIHVTFTEPWIRQVTRVLAGQPYVEIEYTIGPIPIDDGRGKEIVTRYASPTIKSNATFFTDSNGREFQRRQRNYRPSWNLDVYEPIAGNYYPVNAAIYLQDSKASMAVVVDRSQGGSSLQDGVLELMVQRRTLADDARGVDEPLNETCGGMTPYPPYGKAERMGEGIVVRGFHRLMVGGGLMGASLARSTMDGSFVEPVVFVGASKSVVEMDRTTFSGLQTALPPNVFVVTLSRLSDRNQTTFLLRLGHQYGVGDDKDLSAPVSVDLGNLFGDFEVDSVTEMSLMGTEKWNDFVNRRLDWSPGGEGQLRSSLLSNRTFVVELMPMEIRTYEIVCSEA